MRRRLVGRHHCVPLVHSAEGHAPLHHGTLCMGRRVLALRCMHPYVRLYEYPCLYFACEIIGT